MENETIQENILYAESIYGAQARRAFVKLSYGISFEIIITPAEARIYALSILEAAEAAEMDEIVMKWMKSKVGITEDELAVALLRDFRLMRVDLAKRDLDDAKRD